MSSIFGVGTGAAETVASALAPRSTTSHATAKSTDSTGSTDSSSSASTSSTITANDFLTLLVSELKNQDPTQPTDPASYITQMVGVNSLQQLIQINQGLSAVENPTTTPAPSAG
jgi:flagellar basal-body rod modification protein FlgD